MENINLPAETQTQHVWRLIRWVTLADGDERDDNNNDIIIVVTE